MSLATTRRARMGMAEPGAGVRVALAADEAAQRATVCNNRVYGTQPSAFSTSDGANAVRGAILVVGRGAGEPTALPVGPRPRPRPSRPLRTRRCHHRPPVRLEELPRHAPVPRLEPVVAAPPPLARRRPRQGRRLSSLRRPAASCSSFSSCTSVALSPFCLHVCPYRLRLSLGSRPGPPLCPFPTTHAVCHARAPFRGLWTSIRWQQLRREPVPPTPPRRFPYAALHLATSLPALRLAPSRPT